MRRLEQSDFIRNLTDLIVDIPVVKDVKYRAPGSVTIATIYDVEDPEERGRIRVSLEDFDPELKGEGEYAQPSVWLEANPPFDGKQPESLVGEKVTVLLVNSDYNRPVLGEVVGETKEPTNKMLRLPIYDKGKLPPANEKNLGLVAVERNAKPGCDAFVVCILENNRYVWAGSSHSIQETTPLGTNAKEIAQMGHSLQTFFEDSVSSIKDGSAFKPIKNKKVRAVLQAVSNALISPIIAPVTKVLQPIRDVDISVLEGSLVRNAEFIPSLEISGEKVIALLEATSGSPFKIPSGIKAVSDLIGGVLNDVYSITRDVKQYLQFDEVGSALGELANFESILKNAPQVVKKSLPNIPGLASREIERVFEDIYSERVTPSIPEGLLEGFSGDLNGLIDKVTGSAEEILGASSGIISSELADLLQGVITTGVDSILPESYQDTDLGLVSALVELVQSQGFPLPDPRSIRDIEDLQTLVRAMGEQPQKIMSLQGGYFLDEL
jgi:hypothetical protein